MYRLKSRGPVSTGWVTVMGKQFTIQNGTLEVDTLEQANILVESGYKILGVEAVVRAKNILIKRGRGLGDLLMVTPVCRLIRRANPTAKITLALDGIFLDLLKGVSCIDRIVTQPQVRIQGDRSWLLLPEGQEEFDYCVNMDGFAEMSDEAPVKHRIDLFAELAGFQVPLSQADRAMEYKLFPDERKKAEQLLFVDKGVSRDAKVLCMAVRSTCFNRNLPADHFRRVADLAIADGWKVVLVDHDPSFGWEAPGIVNMTGQTTIRELGALISLCHIFYGPDSGAWHLASAIGVPNVAYFGAINFKLRVTSLKSKIIFRNADCYPCDGYDCHVAEKLKCLKMTPEECWGVIRRYSERLAEEPGFSAPSLSQTGLSSASMEPAPWNQVDERTYVADHNCTIQIGKKEGVA